MQYELWDKNGLLSYLKDNDLWVKKGLSQNFLIDKEALKKIVEAAELKDSDLVVEIGPGTGILTSELIKSAGEVIAIEQDEKLAKLLPVSLNPKSEIRNHRQLRDPAKGGGKFKISKIKNSNIENLLKIENCKLKIINNDILKVNLNEIIGDRSYKVVANIPYHITSKILELFLSRENKPETMVLLVQKEVAERICAKPGEMSVLAISVQFYGQPKIVDIVPKDSFFPSPKVDSAILKIVISNQPCLPAGRLSVISREQEKQLFRLVHVGFSARRKTIVNNLMNGYKLERQKVSDIIKGMGMKETIRAQELSVEDWKQLSSNF